SNFPRLTAKPNLAPPLPTAISSGSRVSRPISSTRLRFAISCSFLNPLAARLQPAPLRHAPTAGPALPPPLAPPPPAAVRHLPGGGRPAAPPAGWPPVAPAAALPRPAAGCPPPASSPRPGHTHRSSRT